MAQGRTPSGICLSRCFGAAPLLLVLAAGCAGMVAIEGEETSDSAELSVPSRVRVNGVSVDVESNYLPRVVECENPGAPLEAMLAQAVAARTYLAYRSAGRALPSIIDGQADQVYSCAANQYGRFISADAARAVRETAGMVVTVNGKLSAGFFVAGAKRQDVSCRKLSDPTNTERYVTFNYGEIGAEVDPSSIGSRSNVDNRGCLSQNMANCLAESTSMNYKALLRYFYGSDIQVAPTSAAKLSDWAVSQQGDLDRVDATCYSSSFARPVALGACVQTTASGTYYQCGASGQFALASVTFNGVLSGPEGACTEQLSL